MHRKNDTGVGPSQTFGQQPEITAQLQKLLRAFNHQGDQHLMEVDADLRQTQYLLDEAITKLGKNFLEIHAATSAQHALIVGLEEGAVISRVVREKLDALHHATGNCVNAAVTALQFQDMTNQLIGRAVIHVASLHEVLREAGNAGALLTCNLASNEGYEGNDDNAPTMRALSVIAIVNGMLEDKVTVLNRVPGKAVAQTHLESGDIELF